MKNLRSYVNSTRLMELYKKGNWREVLELLQEGGEDERSDDSFFSWLRPTEEDLRFICTETGDSSLVSVGCGNGLLEWLVQACTGLPVIGLEVDRSWWERRRGAPVFLPLLFAEETTLARLCANHPVTLLFCYFNNPEAFEDYVREFAGNTIIIIGPGEGRGTHTDPRPFVNTLTPMWTLKTFQEIGQTKDFIAVYTR